MTFVLSYLIPIILAVIAIELLRPSLYRLIFRWNYKHSSDWQKEIEEDMLKILFHGARDKRQFDISGLAQEMYVHDRLLGDLRLSPSLIADVVVKMRLKGLIAPISLRLTEQGEQLALLVIRRHRLYEKYLAEYSGYKPDEWHSRAERMEHKLSRKEERRIARLLGHPLFDPHGDPIPRESGEIFDRESLHLLDISSLPAFVRITRIQDQPATAYRSITDQGLYPGTNIQIEQITDEGEVIYTRDAKRLRLTAQEASLVSVAPQQSSRHGSEVSGEIIPLSTLSTLSVGQTAIIDHISPVCRGAARRRLLDLGFVSGSLVSIDLESPLGNPIAYLIRGTTIALREDQARHILVRREATDQTTTK